MLSSICARRRCILAWVKFRSRVLHGLELAAVDRDAGFAEQRLKTRHSITNSRQTRRMASPLSLRMSVMVWKSGIRRPVSQTSPTRQLTLSL